VREQFLQSERSFSTPRPLIGPSITQGASMRSQPNAARKVNVRQCPWGTLSNSLFPHGRPAAQAGHVGFGPGLVDEDRPSRIKPALIGFPACASSGDVGTILLGGEQRFFEAEAGSVHGAPGHHFERSCGC